MACGGVSSQTTHTNRTAHKIFIFLPQEWSRRDKKLCGEKFQNIFPIFFFGKAHKIIFYYKSQHISGHDGEIAMCEISGRRMMEISMQIYIEILSQGIERSHKGATGEGVER